LRQGQALKPTEKNEFTIIDVMPEQNEVHTVASAAAGRGHRHHAARVVYELPRYDHVRYWHFADV
jgi:hypothetical protein